MSVERVWVWVCDVCGATWRGTSGTPKGWTWLNVAGVLRHRCRECEGRVEPEFRGVPLGKASAFV